MWVRRTADKFSLLTVGNNTYSGDPRIKVKFQYPNNWRLHINPMQKEDAGLYMCQVSTHPPRVFATNVTVLRKYNIVVYPIFYIFLFYIYLYILSKLTYSDINFWKRIPLHIHHSPIYCMYSYLSYNIIGYKYVRTISWI